MKHDVFLSFCGKDTRYGFISHLDKDLRQKKIQTFIDDKLEKGGEISPALLKAIEESKISVVVFSRNYASSKWCLDELVKIMDCKKMNKHHLVIPVFYRIDPSVVRHQTGSFADAFVKHFKRNTQKVETWRTALTEAANISGWDAQVPRHEARLIEEIVQDILKKLNPPNPGWIGQALLTTNLVGVAAKICMEEIWVYLMGDDVKKIGVWGMGGIGKTTIMKHINNQLLTGTEKFKLVIWVTVSKEMSISKVQNSIAGAMGETLDEDDETIRAGRVYHMLLQKGRHVLILDDLWDRLSLDEVGIPDPEPSNGSKLLVTTRSLDVCRHLDCREVRVPTLSKQDAWSLFSEKVGKDVLNHLDLLPIVQSVAEECDGLPLAIVTIASSMKGVRDIHEWRNAVRELNRNIKSVNGMEEKVFKQLQFSFDRLQDEEVKHCFLCCALYPEDHEIYKEKLIDLWISEGHVEEMDNKQEEIDKGHTILNKLKNSCLIEDNGNGNGFVKLHDVVRDMALRITSVRPRFLVRAGMQLKEIPDVKDWNEDLEKASLMKNQGLQIPSQMPPPKCPKLTTLLLSNCYIENIPEYFLEKMHGLKILDLSCNYIKSLPNSISNLETLTTLLLGGCHRLEKVPSFSKLEVLKKLDLRGTNIKDIPHGMERLVNLKYLDLRYTGITGDGILEKFTSLQHLAIDILERAEEVSGLRKLEVVKGRFYDLDKWNSYVQVLHAQKRGVRQYSICVGPLGPIITLAREKEITLRGCNICTDGIKILSNVEALKFEECIVDLCEEGVFLSKFISVPLNIFSSLSCIIIFKCKNIKKLLSSNWVLHNLQNLKTLSVEGCKEMEEIIASESELEGEGISSPSFNFTLPKLLTLSLKNLPELKSICGANGVMIYDSIISITISNCPKLKRIPLNLSLQDDDQPSIICSKEWWELVEWDHPNAKSLLEPLVIYEDE